MSIKTSDGKAKPLSNENPVSHAPLGPDGKPMRTSVCEEIERSVDRALQIEKQLSSSKVNLNSFKCEMLKQYYKLNN